MAKTEQYDSRKYDCCAPFYGEIGEEFTRRFRPEFEGALHSIVDNYASLYEHVVLQSDPGSAADPAPAGAAGEASRRAFSQRQKRSFGLIRKHVEDSALRDEIDATAMGDGPAAWAIIVARCTRPQTFLNLSDQDNEWTNTTITEVGFTERTVENYVALLKRINRERPVAQRKTDTQIWQKLMDGIAGIGNHELRMLVRNEMQSPTLTHPAGHPNAGQPNVAEYVQRLAERWRVLIHDGTIKQSAPRRRAPPVGHRVDAMLASVENAVQHAFAISNGAADVQEKMCWNCRGFGHTKSDSAGKVICPSPIRNRTIQSCITALESLKNREGLKGKRRVIFRKGRQTAKSAEAVDNDNTELTIDDDGCIYDSNGSEIGNVFEVIQREGAPDATPECGMGMSAEARALSHTNESSSQQTTTASNIPIVDDDFVDGFVPSAAISKLFAAEAEIEESIEEYTSEDIISERKPRVKPRRRTILIAVGSAALISAIALKDRAATRSMIIMGLISLAAASYQPTPHVSVEVALLSARSDPNANILNSRTGAAIDTGASMHVSGRAELFPPSLIADHAPNIKVQVANDTLCQVQVKGTMRLPVKFRNNISQTTQQNGCLMLKNALLVPALGENTLISPRALFHDHGIRTYFNDDLHLRIANGRVVDFAETSTLYVLPMTQLHSATKVLATGVQQQCSADDIHSRCMHYSLERIKRSFDSLSNAAAIAEQLTPTALSKDRERCKACPAAARRHDAKQSAAPKFHKPGDCVCSDTCDMGEYSTPFGFRYFVSFMDMATKYLWVYFLRTHEHKEIKASYMLFMADAHAYLDKGGVKVWFMDNGSEFNVATGVGRDKPGFFANSADVWVAEYMTRRRFIVPWNPQQNPAESMNRILIRPARAAIHAAGVSTRMWPFAIHQSAVVHNALVTDSLTAVHAHLAHSQMSKLIDIILSPAEGSGAKPESPHVMLRKRRFNFELLHTLFCSCECVIRNPTDLAKRSKAAPRTTPAIHLGLDLRRAGFFVYLTEYQRFTTSAFADTHFGDEQSFSNIGPFMGGEVRQDGVTSRLHDEREQREQRPADEARDQVLPEPDEDRAERVSGPPSSRTRARLSQQHARICHPAEVPDGYAIVSSDQQLALAVKADIWRPISCPTSTKEALAQDKEGWTAAYVKDYQAKVANGAFKYVKRDKHMVIHKTKWAHKLIWNDDNTLAEKRARLVGCGYSQVQGRDYESSYSATPRASAVRIFEAAIAMLDLEEEHCDIIKAFTQNAVTDAKVYVYQPPGIEPVLDEDGNEMVIQLIMALEGLKQSGHLHQVNHTLTFTEPNDVASFEMCETEPTLFTHTDKDIRIMALVWTDDVHFAYSSAAHGRYERFLREVYGKRWNYKRKGPVQRFVGVNIRRDRASKKLTLSMPLYIEGIHARFVQKGYPPRSSPYKSADAVKQINTASSEVERERMADKPFLAAVASCIWVYSMLRPDISFVLCVLCSVMHDPSEHAWTTLIDLISYLHSSKDLSITYTGHSEKWAIPDVVRQRVALNHGLHAWVDASWKTPSVAGYVCLVGGGPIDWCSRLIKIVCHSSAEAEVSAGCIAAKNIMYVREVAKSVGICVKGPTVLLMDSEAAIAISNNVGASKRTAHFIRWQHYLRWCKSHFYLEPVYVKGSTQLANALTKAVDINELRCFRKLMFG